MAWEDKLRKLTQERLKQMLKTYCPEDIADIIDDWGADQVNKGYGIFNYDGTGLLGIEAIDVVGAYDDDEATQRAIKDGVKIIPVDELPENFQMRWLGWIDTPENRKAIEEYARKR